MLDKGILLGLGTDAYTQDMFESLKVANLIHRHHLCNPSVGFAESIDMRCNSHAAICARFFQKPLGVVKPGAGADLIVVDYTPHTPLDVNTIAGHIMFGMAGRCVDSTMIGGKFVMRERKMVTVDEEALLARAREQSANFWRRVLQ
jgi:cytosine/adenosine deaminase-related metal-dependent hydrolase